tara:strand:+ start:1933 stop:3243 length:1311 start_codon:yes stop_codon:yes gene_type:complete
MNKRTIVIIGKPNVGKSTLFNRLIGKSKSIVSPIEGVTRDRVYGTFDWLNKEYELIDTGGYLPKDKDDINEQVKVQAEIAALSSNLILFMIDGKNDISINDQILANNIKKIDKPCILIVNKVDNLVNEHDFYKYYELGLGDPICISSTSGRQVGLLLDKINSIFSNDRSIINTKYDISLAIIGMPNVGKSSFVNTILDENKSIVSSIAGTTRDSIDSFINYFSKTIRIIDTAGLRKKTKIIDSIEFYSTIRTMRSVEECDVAAIIIDADKGFHNQDKSIIKDIIDRGKGLIIVVNKWDLIKKDTNTMKDFKDDMTYKFPILKHYPILFMSIKNNLKVREVIKKTLEVYMLRKKKIKTSLLNEILKDIIINYPPPAIKGKDISIKYITQITSSPPLFGIFSNHPDLITKSYEKYLSNQIRQRIDFKGVPIRLSFRKK